MLPNSKVNGEARCFLCLKDKLEEYTFQAEDYLSLVLKKKIYCQSQAKPPNSKEASKGYSLNNIEFETNTLIKPCKCGNYFHIPCLIQYCILHLSFKCSECQADYNVSFQEYPGNANWQSCDKISLIFLYIFTCILHIGCLVLSILFFMSKIFQDKFIFWNYFLGVVALIINVLLSIGNFSMLIEKGKLLKKIYPVIKEYTKDNMKKGNEELLSQMELFLEQVLGVNGYELVEKKTNNQMYINTSLNTYKTINEYIIDNNNEIFDINSDRVKDELKNDDIEKKFHGHQIIKSTLVMNDQQGIKNMLTKKNTKTSKNLGEVKLPKSLTKGGGPLKKDLNPPRRSLNMVNAKSNDSGELKPATETKEKIYGDEVINSKSKLAEGQEVALNVGQKQTIEQQAIEKLTLMKKSSNTNVVEGKKEEENKGGDELIQVKKSK